MSNFPTGLRQATEGLPPTLRGGQPGLLSKRKVTISSSLRLRAVVKSSGFFQPGIQADGCSPLVLRSEDSAGGVQRTEAKDAVLNRIASDVYSNATPQSQ